MVARLFLPVAHLLGLWRSGINLIFSSNRRDCVVVGDCAIDYIVITLVQRWARLALKLAAFMLLAFALFQWGGLFVEITFKLICAGWFGCYAD